MYIILPKYNIINIILKYFKNDISELKYNKNNSMPWLSSIDLLYVWNIRKSIM